MIKVDAIWSEAKIVLNEFFYVAPIIQRYLNYNPSTGLFFFFKDPSCTPEPAQKKQKLSSNLSIGRLQNKAKLASLVKVKKDRTIGQKMVTKGTTEKETLSLTTEAKMGLCEYSNRNDSTADSSSKTDTAKNGLGSLNMLGNYSSSEDSDQ